MKNATRWILALVTMFTILGATPTQSDAWPRRRYRYTRTYVAPVQYKEEATDQEMCEAEAAYQAANYVYAHVGVNIGHFEGWGCGSTPKCGTCIPAAGMTLTGDASVQAANGMWFRVRSWR